MDSDYFGAKNAGLGRDALLLRRHGETGAEERREADEDLSGIQGDVIASLEELLERVG